MAIERTLIAQRARMDQMEAKLHELVGRLDDQEFDDVFRMLRHQPEALRHAPPKVLRLVGKLAAHTLAAKALADLERDQLEGAAEESA